MKTIKAIDNYFLGYDDGTLSDRLWFYFSYAIALLFVTITLF